MKTNEIALTPFETEVLQTVALIPRGRVSTYRALAAALHRPGSARAVGNALNKNPRLISIPCHRVVCSDGRIGGYAGGTKKKIGLLRSEGIKIVKNRVSNFEHKMYSLL